MPPYTKRLLSLPEYPLAKIPEQKRQLIARGVDVIDLGAGDADLAPPPAVLDRISAAVRIPTMSRYGFALGLVEYREAVARFMKRRFGQDFDPIKEIVPLIGVGGGETEAARIGRRQRTMGVRETPRSYHDDFGECDRRCRHRQAG